MKFKLLLVTIIFLIVVILVIVFFPSKTKNQQDISVTTKSQTMSSNILDSKMPKVLKRPKGKTIKYPELLVVDDLNIELMFESELSEELKQLMIGDFNLIIGETGTYELYDWKQSNPDNIKTFHIAGKDISSTKRLYFMNARPPSILHDHLGHIIPVSGTDKLLVPKVVSDAYEESLLLKNKYLREYEELQDYVYMMTKADEETPITLHPKDVFYMPGAHVLKKLEEQPELIPKAQKFYSQTTRLRMPSVLEFKEIPIDGQKDGIYLRALGYSYNQDEGNIPQVETGFVYHEGRWKIFGLSGM